MIRFYLLQLTIIFCVLATTSCRPGADHSAVIASVNGTDVHRDEFESFVATKIGEFSPAETADALRSQMLDEFIKRRLVLDEAARAGLTVSSTEVDQAALDNPQLKSSSASAEKREEFRRDLLVEKYYRQVVLRDVHVSPDEVKQYVDRSQSGVTDKPGFYVREIRVQSREEADKLRREVTEGKADFASVARLHSDAPNGQQGGLARYDEGQLPDVLGRAVQALRPGDISPVIESAYGFHIFKLERRIQPYPPEERRSKVDDRRTQLADELIGRRNQEAVEAAMDRLSSEAAIKLYDAALGFTYSGRLRHN